MQLKTQLLLLVGLLCTALLVNLIGLGILTRAFTQSLQTIQAVTVRQQASALKMQASLRDAEAALYRYQIEGESGFVEQFEEQLQAFENEIILFEALATTDVEQAWVAELELAHQNSQLFGHELIRLRDEQSAMLQMWERLHHETNNYLRDEIAIAQNDNAIYQAAMMGMAESLGQMSVAVSAFLTAANETERDQARVLFTESAVAFQQHLDQFQTQPNTDDWVDVLENNFANIEATGSRLISGSAQQQDLFAQFAAILFRIGQQLIVSEIQPQTTRNLALAEAELTTALRTGIWVSGTVGGITAVLAIIGTMLLLRQMGTGIQGLLSGAERVAKGDLSQPIAVAGANELARLSHSFNLMMDDLASREQRLQARLSELEVLRQVSLQLTSTLASERILTLIAESALTLVHAAEVHIFLYDAPSMKLQFGASVWRNTVNIPRREPRPDGLVQQSIQTEQVQIIEHAQQHPLFDTPEAATWNILAAAAYPLKRVNHILGVLKISLDDRVVFSEAELRILRLLADQAAVTLENVRLYQNIAENETRLNHLVQQLALVQEEERRLVGLDLHDGLTQILLSANMHLNAYRELIHDLNVKERFELELAHTRLQEAIDEVCWVVAELRPTELEDFGLVDGLRNYVAKVAQIEGWQLDFVANSDKLALAPTIETALFRIAQEAINNARKHSETDRIYVELGHDTPNINLTIQDWGKGFEIDDVGSENEHLGLIGMQERAALLGGNLRIESGKGRGTVVRATIETAVSEKDEYENK